MANTGFHVFDTAIQKTNLLLSGIEEDFGWEDRREQSYTALREVLHALRDRLQVNVATNFAAQLPLLVKGVFYDNWDPSSVPVKMDREEFVNRIQENFPYSVEGGVEAVINSVFKNLFEQMDEGTVKSIQSSLPSDLAEFTTK